MIIISDVEKPILAAPNTHQRKSLEVLTTQSATPDEKPLLVREGLLEVLPKESNLVVITSAFGGMTLCRGITEDRKKISVLPLEDRSSLPPLFDDLLSSKPTQKGAKAKQLGTSIKCCLDDEGFVQTILQSHGSFLFFVLVVGRFSERSNFLGILFVVEAREITIVCVLELPETQASKVQILRTVLQHHGFKTIRVSQERFFTFGVQHGFLQRDKIHLPGRLHLSKDPTRCVFGFD
mmetsp:Transcript_1908/g.2923  ORF Transcript_1908/g.2923 Transcript_1908/m.2923 type:complete len:236 (-) Transcript_1908:795-1502(-)